MDKLDQFQGPDNRQQREGAEPAVNQSGSREMVRLTTVYPPEDIFLESVLQQAEILVIKKKESIAGVQGISFGPLAEVQIYVPKHQATEAREILASLTEPEKDGLVDKF